MVNFISQPHYRRKRNPTGVHSVGGRRLGWASEPVWTWLRRKVSLPGTSRNDLYTTSKSREVSPNFCDILLHIISQNYIQYNITNIFAIDCPYFVTDGENFVCLYRFSNPRSSSVQPSQYTGCAASASSSLKDHIIIIIISYFYYNLLLLLLLYKTKNLCGKKGGL